MPIAAQVCTGSPAARVFLQRRLQGASSVQTVVQAPSISSSQTKRAQVVVRPRCLQVARQLELRVQAEQLGVGAVVV